jgi:hypothetical protein
MSDLCLFSLTLSLAAFTFPLRIFSATSSGISGFRGARLAQMVSLG